jgi:hypothetical protein
MKLLLSFAAAGAAATVVAQRARFGLRPTCLHSGPVYAAFFFWALLVGLLQFLAAVAGGVVLVLGLWPCLLARAALRRCFGRARP